MGWGLSKARQTAPSITREIPKAINGIECNSRYAVGMRPIPAKNNPKPNSLYWFLITNTVEIEIQVYLASSQFSFIFLYFPL